MNKKKSFAHKINTKVFGPNMQVRLLILIIVSFALLAFLTFRLFMINHENTEVYAKRVYDNLRYTNKSILAKRGEIVDRNGTVLAYSQKVYNLILDPKEYYKKETDKELNIKAVADNFGYTYSEIKQMYESYDSKTQKAYVKIKTQITEQEAAGYIAAKQENAEITASWLEEEYMRIYPYGDLAAPVIGYASETSGVIGVESYYNDYLTGTNGREYGYVSEDADLETTIKSSTNGCRVQLTLDINIQRIVQNKIKEFNEEYGSLTTSVIIADPNDGSILAMAQYPTFDLNDPKNLSGYYTDEEIAEMTDDEKVNAFYGIWSNYCVSNIYEPGSVFKTFTIASGIENGKLDGTEEYYCDGAETVQGVSISCAHTEGHGELTLSQALEESCNDALMQIVAGIGTETFAPFIRQLGFGAKTGIDLPGEEYGLLYNQDAMTAIDLATNSFGQNLNVTMVQQVAAFSSIINGGNYYQPHILKKISSVQGETVAENNGVLVKQTISKETGETMKQYLKNVVDYGTGSYLQIPGYSVAGKTGAAEKQPRDKTHYLISFMGFMPAENPEVLFYVIIDEPEVEDFSSSRAAQVLAHDIMVDLIPYLEIYPEDPSYEININHKDEPEYEFETDENGDIIWPTDEEGNPYEYETEGANDDNEPLTEPSGEEQTEPSQETTENAAPQEETTPEQNVETAASESAG